MADSHGQATQLAPTPASHRGLLYQTWFLAALIWLGLGLTAIGVWQLLAPGSNRLPLGQSLPGNDRSLPSEAALPVAIAVVVLLALLVGTIGGRRRYRTRVMMAVVTVGLLASGISVVAPPALRQIPGQISNAFQGVMARPESGYPRIKVSRVGIDLLLVRGDGKTPPVRYAAFTYPGADNLLTGSQAGGGNSYVYAHDRKGMFAGLHDLRAGDVIVVDYGSGRTLRYSVADIHPGVNWKDLTFLRPTTDDRLTLQTCNGWQDEDPRFIVVAHRIQGNTA